MTFMRKTILVGLKGQIIIPAPFVVATIIGIFVRYWIPDALNEDLKKALHLVAAMTAYCRNVAL